MQLPLPLRYDPPALKILSYCLAAFMAAFALLQLNDPDSLVWVVAYGLVAVCLAVPQRPWSARLAWLTGGVLLTLGLLALPGFFDYLATGEPGSLVAEMSADQPQVESAREFLGVLIAGLLLAGMRWGMGRRRIA